MQTCGSPVVEWMSQRNFRLNPGQPESFERKRFEKRRTSCERMHRRTNVMLKRFGKAGRLCGRSAIVFSDAKLSYETPQHHVASVARERSRSLVCISRPAKASTDRRRPAASRPKLGGSRLALL